MSERRVVVTGIGVISPVGNDLDTFWKNLTEGRSGISRYKAFDSAISIARLPGRSANSIPPSTSSRPRTPAARIGLPSSLWRRRKSLWRTPGIDLDNADHERFGVMVGSGIGGLRSMEEECRRLIRSRPVPCLAIHHCHDDQQHGKRTDLHGIRPAGAEYVHRHRLRHRQSLDR